MSEATTAAVHAAGTSDLPPTHRGRIAGELCGNTVRAHAEAAFGLAAQAAVGDPDRRATPSAYALHIREVVMVDRSVAEILLVHVSLS